MKSWKSWKSRKSVGNLLEFVYENFGNQWKLSFGILVYHQKSLEIFLEIFVYFEIIGEKSCFHDIQCWCIE